MRKDFRNSLNVMSENWFSATAGREEMQVKAL